MDTARLCSVIKGGIKRNNNFTRNTVAERMNDLALA
jgi:hypothetical protein